MEQRGCKRYPTAREDGWKSHQFQGARFGLRRLGQLKRPSGCGGADTVHQERCARSLPKHAGPLPTRCDQSDELEKVIIRSQTLRDRVSLVMVNGEMPEAGSERVVRQGRRGGAEGLTADRMGGGAETGRLAPVSEERARGAIWPEGPELRELPSPNSEDEISLVDLWLVLSLHLRRSCPGLRSRRAFVCVS